MYEGVVNYVCHVAIEYMVSLSENTSVFFDFSLTVKAAPHESVIRTGQA